MNKKEIIKSHLKLYPEKKLLKLNRNLTEWYGEYYSQSDDKYIDMEALDNTTYEQVLNVLDEMVDLIITEYNKDGKAKEDLLIILYYHSDLLLLLNIIFGGSKMKEPIDYLEEYDRQIAEDNLSIEELKKLRRKIYRFKDGDLTDEEYYLKHTMLICIKEMIADER